MVNFDRRDQDQKYNFGSLGGWFQYQPLPLHSFLTSSLISPTFSLPQFYFPGHHIPPQYLQQVCNSLPSTFFTLPSLPHHLTLSLPDTSLPPSRSVVVTKQTKQAEPLNLEGAIGGLRLFSFWGNSVAAGSQTNIKTLKTSSLIEAGWLVSIEVSIIW